MAIFVVQLLLLSRRRATRQKIRNVFDALGDSTLFYATCCEIEWQDDEQLNSLHSSAVCRQFSASGVGWLCVSLSVAVRVCACVL